MSTTHVNAVASSSKAHKEKDPNRKKSKKDKHAHTAPSGNVQINGDAAAGAAGESAGGKKHKHSKKDKHHHHHHSSGGHSSSSSSKTPWQHQRSRMRMSIAPKFSADQLVGVREALDALVMRYVPQLQGVLLSHWDHTFQDDTVQLINECPFGIAEVEFDSIIWAPKIGQKLYGTHSLSSPSHLSLLYNKTFNISIPLQHIPLDAYEFEATDPADEEEQDSDSEDEEEEAFTGFGMAKGVEEVGRWKVKSTGKLVGEGGKGVKFTVIGMQVTNQMLSLTGSLLADPSDPPELSSLPIPSTSISTSAAAAAAARRVESPTPEPPTQSQRPAKRPANANASTKAQAKANARNVVTDKTPVAPSQSAPAPTAGAPSSTAAAAAAPAVDPKFLTQREQKKLRKEEEKRKREARKERKGHADGPDVDADVGGAGAGAENVGLEATIAQGGEASVRMDGRDEQVQQVFVDEKDDGGADAVEPADKVAGKGKKRKMEGEEGRKKKKERKA